MTIENNARLGGCYPTTLFEAYKLVSELADLPTINATSSSVFATTRTDTGGKKGGGKKSEEKNQDGATKKEFTGKCFKCDKVGHQISECPEGLKAKRKLPKKLLRVKERRLLARRCISRRRRS